MTSKKCFECESELTTICLQCNTRAVPDVPELVRYQPIAVTWDDGSPKTTEMVVSKEGEYVLYSEAAAKVDTFKGIYKSASRGNEKLRAKLKAAEAELAQYEAQEPITDCDHQEAIRILSLCSCKSCSGFGERNDAESGAINPSEHQT